MCDSCEPFLSELHQITDQIITMLNMNIRFNIELTKVSQETSLFFDDFILKLLPNGLGFEIELLNKDLFERFKKACANYEYPGLVVPFPISAAQYNKLSVDAYNKYLETYYMIDTKFKEIQNFSKYSDSSVKITGIDEMPYHIYHSLKNRVFLPTNCNKKKYFRVVKNPETKENELEIYHYEI
jgi:hypothetical protein